MNLGRPRPAAARLPLLPAVLLGLLASALPGYEPVDSCRNSWETAPYKNCHECEGESDVYRSVPESEPCPLGTSASRGSVILNAGMDYLGEAADYRPAPEADGGCGGCGAARGGAGTALPSLRVTRLFRPRKSRTSPGGSFGRGAFWKELDRSLRLNLATWGVEVVDPGSADHYTLAFPDAPRGVWSDFEDGRFASLELLGADGGRVTAGGDMGLARSAVLLRHDGVAEHYEIFRGTSGQFRHGRLTAITDRNGNAVTVGHEVAIAADGTPGKAGASGEELFLLERAAWKRTRVADARGREILVENALDGASFWRVSRLVLPGGRGVTYSRGRLPGLGRDFLTRAVHPDGSVSRWSSGKDAEAGLAVVRQSDPAAEPLSRGKTLRLSLRSGPGGTASQTPGLVREARLGNGEVRYANRISGGLFHFHNGGRKVTRTRFRPEGGGEFMEVLAGGMGGGELDGAELGGLGWETVNASQSHDGRQLYTGMTDALGRSLSFSRDPVHGAASGAAYPDGSRRKDDLNAFQQPLVTTDRLGRRTERAYDERGNLVSLTEGAGTAEASTRRWRYNRRGQVTREYGPLYSPAAPDMHVTVYRYDTRGYLRKKIGAADHPGGPRPVTWYRHDDQGRLKETTDPQGRVTRHDYDDRERLVRTTYNDGSADLVEYGDPSGPEAGLVVSRTDRNGIRTAHAHDKAGRVVETTVTDPAAPGEALSRETRAYLPGTTLATETVRDGERTEYRYDHANRLAGTVRHARAGKALSTFREIDQMGRLRSETDPYGRRTYYLHDQNDRVTRTVRETVPGGLGEVPAIVPGSRQAARLNDPGDPDGSVATTSGGTVAVSGLHSVTYSCPRDLFLEGLERDPSPNARYLVTDVRHDSEGQARIETDERGVRTLRVYDALGRQTRVFRAAGTPSETLAETDHDKAGNVLERRHPRHFAEKGADGRPLRAVERWEYNGRGLVKSHVVAAGHPALEASESWTYNPDGTVGTHTDFRGNSSRSLWHRCCGRLLASVARTGGAPGASAPGTGMTILNTDFMGNPTHTARVKTGDVSPWDASGATDPAYPWHDPGADDTLTETTARFDGLGRVTRRTAWLRPLGTVIDHARPALPGSHVQSGAGGTPELATDVPIAGEDGIPAADGLTTRWEHDDDLTDGKGLDAAYAAQLQELARRSAGLDPAPAAPAPPFFGDGADGSAVAVTNPAGETSAVFRDGLGRVVMEVDAEGHARTFHHDRMLAPAAAHGVPVPGPLLAAAAVDANGNKTLSYADGAGRAIAREDASGALWLSAHDAAGNVVSARDPNGRGENCAYDELGRRTACADLQEQREGTKRQWAYNAHGQVVKTTDQAGHTTAAEHDARGRAVKTTDENGNATQYRHDANGNLVALMDPEGHVRAWWHDERNLRIKHDRRALNFPPPGAPSPSSAQPPSADIVTWTRDAMGRVKATTDQIGWTRASIYDLAGRMTALRQTRRVKDRTKVFTNTYEYDAASRLVKTFEDFHKVTTLHAYHPDGVPKSETLQIGSHAYTIRRTHDPANRPLTQTYPDGKVAAWDWDERNLVTSVNYEGEGVATFGHDPGARTVAQTFLSGNLQRTIAYGRLDNLRTGDTVAKNGTPVPDLALSYAYTSKKQVAAETTGQGSLLAHAGFTASHDPASRLTGIVRSDGVPPSFTQKTWSYDKNGNWSRVETDGRGADRAHDNADQVTAVGASTLSHGPRGNLVKDHDGNRYGWGGPAGRLGAVRKDGQTTKYKYDALGRRVWRKKDTPPTVLVWWGDHEQAELEEQSGLQTVENYIHSDPRRLNALIARAVGGDERKIQHYHKNHLDHVYAVSDKNGNILERYRYSPFGQLEIYSPTGTYLGNSTKNSAIGNTRTWNTRILDPDTNLYMYKYRHYHAALGRFMSRDPIGEAGGPNLYAFVRNNPLKWIDILGLDRVGEWISDLYFGNWWWQIRFWEDDKTEKYNDGVMGTMATRTTVYMDRYYGELLRDEISHGNVTSKWKTFGVPHQEALSPWFIRRGSGTRHWGRRVNGGFSDAGFWLNQAHKVDSLGGTYEARCRIDNGKKIYEYKNTKGKFRWFDTIDSSPNSKDPWWFQLLETLNEIPEWITAAEFDVEIDFEDNRPIIRTLK